MTDQQQEPDTRDVDIHTTIELQDGDLTIVATLEGGGKIVATSAAGDHEELFDTLVREFPAAAEQAAVRLIQVMREDQGR